MVRWKLHRYATDHLRLFSPFTRSSRKRALFLSITDEISHAQIFPFFDLSDVLCLQLRELPLDIYLAGRNPYARVDLEFVFLQTMFDLSDEQMNALLDAIERDWPTAKIRYLDWFAPADLRYAKVLSPRVDLYIKKQVLKNFADYSNPVIGDTNLTDYYARRFGLNLQPSRNEIPTDFEAKLVLGTGFEYSPRIFRLLSTRPIEKDLDLHARVQANGADWYKMMRSEAHTAVHRLAGLKMAVDGRVSSKQFFRELAASKMCFSPFGYGEVCWRDFEAMALSATVIKPDMSHLRLASDIFAEDTYIPVKWDFSDLNKVFDLKPDQIEAMAASAKKRLMSVTARETVAGLLGRLL